MAGVVGDLRRQLAAKDIELVRWQKIAMDEKATNILHNAHQHENRYSFTKTEALQQATEELNLQVTQPDDDNLTIAYMLGGKKADERLQVLRKYTEQLEKEFLKLKEQDIHDNGPFYHTTTITGQHTPFDPEKIEQMAQAALAKIREGKV